MIARVLFVALALATSIQANALKKCYACSSLADCEATGAGRVQQCAPSTQCYTVKFNGQVLMKGCTADCGSFMERESRLHICHTCHGDLCNSDSAHGVNRGYEQNEDDLPYFVRGGRTERSYRSNNHNSGIGGGASISVGGASGGIGGGASVNNGYGSGIGGGASVNHGSGIGSGAGVNTGYGSGIGDGASVNNGYGSGIGSGAGVNNNGGHRGHHKRNIGHGVQPHSSSNGGIGGGAQPEWVAHGGNGNAGGYDPYGNSNSAYPNGGIGQGARPMSASVHSSVLTLLAPAVAMVLRR